jgi:hypothetical protein
MPIIPNSNASATRHCQSKLGIVCQTDGFFLGLESKDRRNRPERFLAEDQHVRSCIRYHRRLIERATHGMALTHIWYRSDDAARRGVNVYGLSRVGLQLRSNLESRGLQLMVMLFSDLGLLAIGVTDCLFLMDYDDFSEQFHL